jgi:hypothetical protein
MSMGKPISVFLLLSFLIMLGHSVIPHHHHPEVVTNIFTDSCPNQHEDHQDTETNPEHCHAFNDLIFFKSDVSDIHKRSRGISLFSDQIHKFEHGFFIDRGIIVNLPLNIAALLSVCIERNSVRGPPELK